MRPFQIEIGPQIHERLDAEADSKTLDGAIRRYTHSRAYAFACARSNAMWHNLGGKPVEPVSERDRLAATTRTLMYLGRRKQRKAKGAHEATPGAS